jgi:hypothetical protein
MLSMYLHILHCTPLCQSLYERASRHTVSYALAQVQVEGKCGLASTLPASGHLAQGIYVLISAPAWPECILAFMQQVVGLHAVNQPSGQHLIEQLTHIQHPAV